MSTQQNVQQPLSIKNLKPSLMAKIIYLVVQNAPNFTLKGFQSQISCDIAFLPYGVKVISPA